jgi:hypothetical protein
MVDQTPAAGGIQNDTNKGIQSKAAEDAAAIQKFYDDYNALKEKKDAAEAKLKSARQEIVTKFYGKGKGINDASVPNYLKEHSSAYPKDVAFYKSSIPLSPGKVTSFISPRRIEQGEKPVVTVTGNWKVNYGWETSDAAKDPQDYDASFYFQAWSNGVISSVGTPAKKLIKSYDATAVSSSGKNYGFPVFNTSEPLPDLSSISWFLLHSSYSTLSAPNIIYCPEAKDISVRIQQASDEVKQYTNAMENLNTTFQGQFPNAPSLVDTGGIFTSVGVGNVIYNVGSVSDAYFSASANWQSNFTTLGFANSPTSVARAQALWTTSTDKSSSFTNLSNKGMIQSWTQNTSGAAFVATPTNPDRASQAGDPAPSSIDYKGMTGQVRGFQFQYNPASVNMSYSGTPGVDINFEASGGDKFNPVGVPAGTQATVGFSILINRVFDKKYYDVNTGLLLPGYSSTTTLAGAPYYPRQPKEWEQKDIYNKGTMYDIEYLLRVLVGWTMTPFFSERASGEDGKTSDIGFTTGRPVELHLGKSLRYIVYIGQITIEHVLFDERMVPLFSNVGIVCNRIPDFNQIIQADGSIPGGVQDAKDAPNWTPNVPHGNLP